MRRFGESVDPDRAYRTRPGVYGIVRDGADVLITEQRASTREFQLPGGGIDPGESPLRALHRECLEETGWRIVVRGRLGAFQRYCYMPEYDLWARKVCHIYLCRPALRHDVALEPGHRAIWMPIPTAIDLLSSAGDSWFLAALARRPDRLVGAG